MALKLRLARAGSKKRPYYHIVVADVRSPRDGRFIEQVGSWNPMLHKDGDRVVINADRVKHWMANGALPTDRVARFLAEAGLAERAPRNNPNKAEPGKAAKDRLALKAKKEEAAEAARLKAEEDARAAAAAPAAAEEAAAEEPATAE